VRIPWELIVSFVIGLALICLTGYLLLVPMKFLWRLLAGGVLGALALVLVEFQLKKPVFLLLLMAI
jgi:hypothetical protein